MFFRLPGRDSSLDKDLQLQNIEKSNLFRRGILEQLEILSSFLSFGFRLAGVA